MTNIIPIFVLTSQSQKRAGMAGLAGKLVSRKGMARPSRNQIYLDCGGKQSATPLSQRTRVFTNKLGFFCAQKRCRRCGSATAVQNLRFRLLSTNLHGCDSRKNKFPIGEVIVM